ncbi:MAG: lipid-A-disaccharide synthase-related protein [Cyanobacteriota bacterium]|nr:lipid-A-disaccharide synthase-related protein [Cyanobacteriota bacterium]
MPPRLLVVSNGHGEDLIALRVIEALLRLRADVEIGVLPLVGRGAVFEGAERGGLLRRLGPQALLPSGGFSNQSLGGLVADLAAGLPALSWQQLRLVRRWADNGAAVLAVGDLLPLLMAWLGGGCYGFIGTPKSDYTWATPDPAAPGCPSLSDRYHRSKGSEWDPWEWTLMATRRCRLVAVRDQLTARGLGRHGVAALAPGNPMMDGFDPQPPPKLQGRRILLLPGSRMPEALANLERLLGAVTPLHLGQLCLLLPTGSQPTPGQLAPLLQTLGFVAGGEAADAGAASCWFRGPLELLVGPGAFARWAPWAELGLACAGTATEQLAGLGCGALSLPGPGPQFTPAFAHRQSRLLGGAVQVCQNPSELGKRLGDLLADAELRRQLGERGRRRMGPAGGSQRLASLIAERLLATPPSPTP